MNQKQKKIVLTLCGIAVLSLIAAGLYLTCGRKSLPEKNPALKLKTIEGAPPSIQEEIFGCKFHPRCDYFQAGVCDKKVPALEEIAIYHSVACFWKKNNQ